jgi:hypothetical protein
MEENKLITDSDRRDVLKGAGLAVGLAALTSGTELAEAQPISPTSALSAARVVTSDAEDPKAPPGFRAGDMLDNRFRVTYERSIPAAMAVVTQHFAAISERNLAGIADTLHFPFAIYEQWAIRMPVVVKTRDAFMKRQPASLGMSMHPQRFTDHDSWLRPGLYDVLVSAEVLQFDPTMANVAMTYDRFDENGHRLLRCEGVYAITNCDGKWGITIASTIFKPAEQIGIVSQDAIVNAYMSRKNHVQSYWDNNPDLEELSGHDTYPKVGITGGGVGTLTANSATDPMAAFKIKGVKSRLSLQETPPPGPKLTTRQRLALQNIPPPADGNDAGPRWNSTAEGFDKLGKDIERGTYAVQMLDSRIIHQSPNKVHVTLGNQRINVTGEGISTTFQTQIVTYKNGVWASDAALGYFTTHARLNDIPRKA